MTPFFCAFLLVARAYVLHTSLILLPSQEDNHPSRFWGQCGSYGYRAPEVVMDESCGPYSDIYSLGVTVYYFIYGKVPWPQTMVGVEGAPLNFPSVPGLTESMKQLISRMLEFDPQHRITIEEIMVIRYSNDSSSICVYSSSNPDYPGQFIPCCTCTDDNPLTNLVIDCAGSRGLSRCPVGSCVPKAATRWTRKSSLYP